MIIDISDEEKLLCIKFANDVVNTNVRKYAQRNQTDKKKIIEDIYIGKVAEYATYNYLKSKGRQLEAPDIKIYGAKNKSFSADLSDGSLMFHVKCMKHDTAKRFGLSWSFQKEDPLVTRPDNRDVLVLCEYIDGTIDIKSVIQAKRVINIYTKPVLEKLWGIKKVLQWNDINNLIKE